MSFGINADTSGREGRPGHYRSANDFVRSAARNRQARADLEREDDLPSVPPIESKIRTIASRLFQMICSVRDTIALALGYEHNRGVAIGAGVAAVVALVSCVALAIIFPPLSLPLILGVGALALALGATSIIHAVKAVKGKSILDDPIKAFENLKGFKELKQDSQELIGFIPSEALQSFLASI